MAHQLQLRSTIYFEHMPIILQGNPERQLRRPFAVFVKLSNFYFNGVMPLQVDMWIQVNTVYLFQVFAGQLDIELHIETINWFLADNLLSPFWNGVKLVSDQQ